MELVRESAELSQQMQCLTAACGVAEATALSLLAKGPSHLTAVDLSFAQICEIALKAAAVRELDVQQVRVLLDQIIPEEE